MSAIARTQYTSFFRPSRAVALRIYSREQVSGRITNLVFVLRAFELKYVLSISPIVLPSVPLVTSDKSRVMALMLAKSSISVSTSGPTILAFT